MHVPAKCQPGKRNEQIVSAIVISSRPQAGQNKEVNLSQTSHFNYSARKLSSSVAQEDNSVLAKVAITSMT